MDILKIEDLVLCHKSFLTRKARDYEIEICAYNDDNSRYTIASFEYNDKTDCYILNSCYDRLNNPNINWEAFGTLVLEGYKYLSEKAGNAMNKEKLKEIFEDAKQRTIDVILELTVPGRDESEYIIAMYGNLDYKLDYYLNNYNDNLELIRCPDVKILSAKAIDSDTFLD